jgi:hypothetical protein
MVTKASTALSTPSNRRASHLALVASSRVQALSLLLESAFRNARLDFSRFFLLVFEKLSKMRIPSVFLKSETIAIVLRAIDTTRVVMEIRAEHLT